MSNTAIEKHEKHDTLKADENTQFTQPERAEQATYFTPLVDIAENADGFAFLADLPGVKPADLDVSFENGTLTIAGRVSPRQPAGTNYVWREYGVGHFYRSFTLNTPVNVDGITAELKNGELRLWVPKADHAKTRKIQIKS